MAADRKNGLSKNTYAMAVGFFVWYTCSNWVSALSYSASFSNWWLNKSGAAVVSTILICLLLWKTGFPKKTSRTLDWIFSGVYAAAMIILLISSIFASPTGSFAGLMMFAVAEVWMVSRWGSHYACASTKDVSKALLLAIVMVAVTKSVTTFLFQPITMVFMLLLPFLSSAMLGLCHKTAKTRALPQKTPTTGAEIWFDRNSLSSFTRIITAMAAFFFIWSILNMTLKQGTGHYSFGVAAMPAYTLISQGILIVFCLAVTWWVFRRQRRLDLTVVWRFTYVLMTVALFMLVAFGMNQFIQAFTGAAVAIAKMFLWLGLANVARHSNFKPFMVFCLGMLLYSLPDWLGRSTASFLGLESLDPGIVAFMMMATVVMVAFFLPSRSPDVQLLLSDLNGAKPPVSTGGSSVDDRCAAVGAKHGLSPREIEIMGYLCRGRSRPYIAETLYLSENTVRTHSRRIYGKLDVHSKQELLDLVSSP